MMKTLIALMLMTLFSAPAFAAVKTSDKAPVFSLSDRSRKEHSLKEFLPSAASAKRRRRDCKLLRFLVPAVQAGIADSRLAFG